MSNEESASIKQVAINVSKISGIPNITFSGSKYEPVIILTGTDEEFNHMIEYLKLELSI